MLPSLASADRSRRRRAAARAALDRKSAADFDDRAVDVARFVRREESESVRDLFWFAETAHRHFLFQRTQHALGHAAEDARCDEARAHRVRAYALAPELARPRLDHADHTELRRCVVGLAEVAVEADD